MKINSALPIIQSSPKGVTAYVTETATEGKAKLKEAAVLENQLQQTSEPDVGSQIGSRLPAPLPALKIDLRVLSSEADTLVNQQAINAYQIIETFSEPELPAAKQGLDIVV